MTILVRLACEDRDTRSGWSHRRRSRQAVAVALLADLERAGAVAVIDSHLHLVDADTVAARLASRHAPAVVHALTAARPLTLAGSIAAMEGPADRVSWDLLIRDGDARDRRRPGCELTNTSATHWWRMILATAPRNTRLWPVAVALWAILAEAGLHEGLCEDVQKAYRDTMPPGVVLELLLPLHRSWARVLPRRHARATPRPLPFAAARRRR
ncbi:hypothetical protein BS329_15875 [Amycolatopsis coloradensis]|uniref:Uncharacterized protein n=1 Tax=Amycolatopsis coloradensis TaxID=76021 RepID=A0A1R0KUC5_9PSEU|nr:hypothetical protein [Amycolatopsis coloradensis]OLZ51739.1 hypothetical protein BS329_15875 [Amycolatopsis coloradensis]